MLAFVSSFVASPKEESGRTACVVALVVSTFFFVVTTPITAGFLVVDSTTLPIVSAIIVFSVVASFVTLLGFAVVVVSCNKPLPFKGEEGVEGFFTASKAGGNSKSVLPVNASIFSRVKNCVLVVVLASPPIISKVEPEVLRGSTKLGALS